MYILKHIPEDFKVVELADRFQTLHAGVLNESGPYLYFKLTKRDLNTIDAIRRVAVAVGIDPKDIGFAGTKDKNAVTVQYCSCRGGRKDRFLNLHLEGISVEVLGFGTQPISLGDLDGNSFEIVVRNLGQFEVVRPVSSFVNYFDEQRFSEHNAEIGKFILLGRLLDAAKLVDLAKVQESLVSNPTDGARALRLVPAKLLRMYVNAYQSLLWNRVVSRLVGKLGVIGRADVVGGDEIIFPFDLDDCKRQFESTFGVLDVPLIGFATAFSELPVEIRLEIEKVLREEGITQKHFVIRAFPELSCEGNMRDVFCLVHALEIGSLEEDAMHLGFSMQRVRFSLGKGSYATMAVRSMVR